jgi:hypothetical protein
MPCESNYGEWMQFADVDEVSGALRMVGSNSAKRRYPKHDTDETR